MTSGISWVGGWSGEQISSRPQSNHMFYIFCLCALLLYGDLVEPGERFCVICFDACAG